MTEKLSRIRQFLVSGLDERVKNSVGNTFVLHSDESLLQQEHLSFGPLSGPGTYDAKVPLLNDYLRLYSNLVPKNMISLHLDEIRSRTRSIVLDRPDDAVRTLEDLVSLVGDIEIFTDLMKVYVLRRDSQRLLSAAGRLYSLHSQLVEDGHITVALQEYLRGPARRPSSDRISLSGEFVESYWRKAIFDDSLTAAFVARYLSSRSLARLATSVFDELLSREFDIEELVEVINVLASGNSDAEKCAVNLAIKEFDDASEYLPFIAAAAKAARYQGNSQLASRIIDSQMLFELDDDVVIDMLRIAGRWDEAAERLVEVLADLDPREVDLDDYQRSWDQLIAPKKSLSTSLEERNPEVVKYLERGYSSQRAIVRRRP
jgi:hypothetical protein